MRIGLCLVASLVLTVAVAGPVAACIKYSRGFTLDGADNVTLQSAPVLIVLATDSGESDQLSWGVIHGTVYWLDVNRVVRGQAPDRLRVRTADACHPATFQEGETVVVAARLLPSQNPVPGVIDRQSIFWVSPDGQTIEQARSPSVNGRRPSTVAELLALLDGLPDTAVRQVPPAGTLTFLGIGALLSALVLANRLRKRRGVASG